MERLESCTLLYIEVQYLQLLVRQCHRLPICFLTSDQKQEPKNFDCETSWLVYSWSDNAQQQPTFSLRLGCSTTPLPSHGSPEIYFRKVREQNQLDSVNPRESPSLFLVNSLPRVAAVRVCSIVEETSAIPPLTGKIETIFLWREVPS